MANQKKFQIPPLKIIVPLEQGNLDYFSEYIKLFFANVVLTTQLKELYSERELLVKKLNMLEVKISIFSPHCPNLNLEKSTLEF